MIVVAHPFGNANVRALLAAFASEGLLAKFITTLGWSTRASWLSRVPARYRSQLQRRSYDLPPDKVDAYPTRELVRLLAASGGLKPLIEHERGWASIDHVWQDLDRRAADYLLHCQHRAHIRAVYAYEDCAAALFEAAGKTGARRVYDLPIAYWELAGRLLREEAERYPDWEPTLGGTRDSHEKLARKTRELQLADVVVCASNFVLESLPQSTRDAKTCVMVPFGSPSVAPGDGSKDYGMPLRVLFAGSMTQRKGLADLFAAMKLIDSSAVELVVMGSPLQPLAWYRDRLARFTYEPPRPHAEVLRLMRSCDLLVLPSIVEGRALVQQEAMACGLPVIATRNAGADDLITDGETGFLVPIRSPEALAEKISWCASNREATYGMGIAAQSRAAQLTWRGYGEKVLAAIQAAE